MTPPITRELLESHPAVQRFVQYVELHLAQAVDLDQIRVLTHREQIPGDPNNNTQNDGIVELSYTPNLQCRVDENCPTFYGKIHGPAQALFLRHGWITPRRQGSGLVLEDSWAMENLPTPIAGACGTVRALGGEHESRTECADYSPLAWWATVAGLNLAGVELFGRMFRRGSFAGWTLRNLRPTGTQTIPASTRFSQVAPGIAAGSAAMFGSNLLADYGFNMHPELHSHERFGMSALSGHSANWGVSHYLARRAGTPRVRTMSFGSGILSAGLVDALIGSQFEEGSAAREMIRGSAFFLPQVYRGIVGNRAMSFVASRPRLATAGRWGTQVVGAAFLTDVGIMGYRYASEGNSESTRNHRVYRRANELRRVDQGWLDNAWRSGLGMIMPSVVERDLVPGQYVDQARAEFQLTANSMANGAAQTIRHNLIFGNAGQNSQLDFYRQVDWGWLRGSNELGVVNRGDRPNWYLDLVAEDLGSADLYRTYFDGKTRDQQIAFIREQYQWDLSLNDAQEVFARLSLHQARSQMADLHTYVTDSGNNFAGIFNESGNLVSGQEQNLTARLFGDQNQTPNNEQILGLRKVSLLVRIRVLRENLREKQSEMATGSVRQEIAFIERDLRTYTGIATELGLMDEAGNFTPGEITNHANRINIPQARLMERSSTSNADLLREVVQYNDGGGF